MAGTKATTLTLRIDPAIKEGLWSQKELLEQLFAYYDHLDEDLKAELPLKRIWMVAAQEE